MRRLQIKPAPRKRSPPAWAAPRWLLHGVIRQRQTEVYLHLIAQGARVGRPGAGAGARISLTPQLEARFREAFPERA